jgi:hypothetical protein
MIPFLPERKMTGHLHDYAIPIRGNHAGLDFDRRKAGEAIKYHITASFPDASLSTRASISFLLLHLLSFGG